ncbi:ubiquitin carboxyl-terminal hydrolase 31 [Sesbania bispinosa]|nr:ubiquitin carboxyl-terminal hydrolase 31 [Sesbania bispinosa]
MSLLICLRIFEEERVLGADDGFDVTEQTPPIVEQTPTFVETSHVRPTPNNESDNLPNRRWNEGTSSEGGVPEIRLDFVDVEGAQNQDMDDGYRSDELVPPPPPTQAGSSIGGSGQQQPTTNVTGKTRRGKGKANKKNKKATTEATKTAVQTPPTAAPVLSNPICHESLQTLAAAHSQTTNLLVIVPIAH